MQIKTANNLLWYDMERYALAVLKQQKYIDSFYDYSEEGSRVYVNIDFSNDHSNRKWFEHGKDPYFSPELTEEETLLLKETNLFSKEELIKIMNSFILETYNLEEDGPDRSSDDNSGISNTEV